MQRQKVYFVTLLTILLLYSTARAQTGIVLEDADDEWTTTTAMSNDLSQSLATVSDHIIVDTSNSLLRAPLTQIPLDLQSKFNTITALLLVDQANSNKTATLVQPGSALGDLLAAVLPDLVIDQANSNMSVGLTYPFELINDQSPPVIQMLLVTPDGAIYRISWQGNEFTRFTLRYGTAPGVYTETITQPLFEREHIVELEGLEDGKRYYFIIESEDISGNNAASQEQSFEVRSSVFNFLPRLQR